MRPPEPGVSPAAATWTAPRSPLRSGGGGARRGLRSATASADVSFDPHELEGRVVIFNNGERVHIAAGASSSPGTSASPAAAARVVHGRTSQPRTSGRRSSAGTSSQRQSSLGVPSSGGQSARGAGTPATPASGAPRPAAAASAPRTSRTAPQAPAAPHIRRPRRVIPPSGTRSAEVGAATPSATPVGGAWGVSMDGVEEEEEEEVQSHAAHHLHGRNAQRVHVHALQVAQVVFLDEATASRSVGGWGVRLARV